MSGRGSHLRGVRCARCDARDIDMGLTGCHLGCLVYLLRMQGAWSTLKVPRSPAGAMRANELPLMHIINCCSGANQESGALEVVALAMLGLPASASAISKAAGGDCVSSRSPSMFAAGLPR